MDIKGATNYIREWRTRELLPDLSGGELRVAAEQLLFQKGWALPQALHYPDGILRFKEGLYHVDTTESTAINEVQYPWDPQDSRVFWCNTLNSDVRLTGDLNADGTYFVVKVGEGYRRYPVKADQIQLRESNSQEKGSDYLAVNISNWTEIKNLLTEQFIPSYPWQKTADSTAKEVREQMQALAKSRKNGIATIIVEERSTSRGKFVSKEEFIIRMNAIMDTFPFRDFAELLDFSV
jgi:hypothetical protein